MLGLIIFGIIVGGIIYFIAEKIDSVKRRRIFFAINFLVAVCISLSGLFISIFLGLSIALPPGGGSLPLGFILSIITILLGLCWAIITTCVIIIRWIVCMFRKRIR